MGLLGDILLSVVKLIEHKMIERDLKFSCFNKFLNLGAIVKYLSILSLFLQGSYVPTNILPPPLQILRNYSPALSVMK